MTVELRTPTEDDLDAMVRADGVAFGAHWTPERFDPIRPTLDLDRFVIGVDAGQIVGIVGSFALAMTLPGAATVSTGGVTWVSVAVTHRRQGLLRTLMDAIHRDIDGRGEPLAALGASEGGIYERFGYGIAAPTRRIEINRRDARIRPEHTVAPGAVRLVDADGEGDLTAALIERWDRARVQRPGEVARTAAWFDMARAHAGPGAVWALHRDGFACWTVDANWTDGGPAHDLRVLDLCAATPDAHLALWHTILSVDLVGTITTNRLPLDDPLPYLLTDWRAVRTAALRDGLWCNVRDVAACFSSRAYGTDDDIVVEVEGARWRIGASGCRKVRTRPDLECDRPSLGALLLGGVRPSDLAAGRRLTARDEATLRRADALLCVGPRPYCNTMF